MARPEPSVPKACEQCNKVFSVWPSLLRKGQGKYCSIPCYRAAHAPIRCTCKQCGKVFSVQPAAFREGRGKYCSHACSSAAQITSVEHACERCGKEFLVKPSDIRDGWGIYCSRFCHYVAKRTNVESVCEQCDKTFSVRPSALRGGTRREGKGRFCSRSCFGSWNVQRQGRKATDIERIVAVWLKSMKIPFETQKSIGAFVCDFFVAPNLILEADGDFWHSLPKNAESDKRKNKYLSQRNIILLRLRGSDIYNNPQWCKQQIMMAYQLQAPTNSGNEHEMAGILCQGVLFPDLHVGPQEGHK